MLKAPSGNLQTRPQHAHDGMMNLGWKGTHWDGHSFWITVKCEETCFNYNSLTIDLESVPQRITVFISKKHLIYEDLMIMMKFFQNQMIYGDLRRRFLEFSIGRLQIWGTMEFTVGCSADLAICWITGYTTATVTLCGGAWFLRKNGKQNKTFLLALKSGKITCSPVLNIYTLINRQVYVMVELLQHSVLQQLDIYAHWIIPNRQRWYSDNVNFIVFLHWWRSRAKSWGEFGHKRNM